MELVVYAIHFGYSVPDEVMEALGIEDQYNGSVEVRSSKAFVDYVKNNGSDVYGIVEIPKEATDWRIFEYDGAESVICVLNGKMVNADIKMYKKV